MHHRHGDFGRRLSEAERLEIRRLVRSGEPYRVAAAAVGTTPKTIGLLMRTTDGLRHRAAARSPLRLSVAEREEISRRLLTGASLRAIARHLGRAPSTIAREVTRNGGRRRYRGWRAEASAIQRARRPRVAKLARSARLRAEVERLLAYAGRPSRSRSASGGSIRTTGRCG
jgi:transposase, IS30 family